MSYILEALRKADAQRQRERPSLHAHPSGVAEDEGPGWARSPLLWAGVGAIVLAGGVYALWPSSEPTPNVAPVTEVAQTAPVPAAPAVVTTPAPAPAPAAAIEPPPPPPVAAAAKPVPAPVASAPAARVLPAPVARAASSSAPRPAATSSAAPTAAAPAPTAAAEGPAPADAPKLAITGGVYSQDPAQRMLIVGGQVFNEGSQVAPGVVLEQVRPHQAVLSFRGQRYSVGY